MLVRHCRYDSDQMCLAVWLLGVCYAACYSVLEIVSLLLLLLKQCFSTT